MGFMDKVKAQAEQGLKMAQQGVSQGQEKLDTMHARRGVEGLLRDLGAAFYAHQRTGGAPEPVQSALAALDAYAAANGPIDTTPTAIHSTGAPTNPAQANGGQQYAAQPDAAAQPYAAQPDAAGQPDRGPAEPRPARRRSDECAPPAPAAQPPPRRSTSPASTARRRRSAAASNSSAKRVSRVTVRASQRAGAHHRRGGS